MIKDIHWFWNVKKELKCTRCGKIGVDEWKQGKGYNEFLCIDCSLDKQGNLRKRDGKK
jgi:hypothetical protein